MDNEFKVCVICKKSCLLSDFNKKSNSSDGLQNTCRQCSSERSRAHYLRNTKKVKQKSSERRLRLRPIIHQMILFYLSKGCVDCGEKDIIVLDFDHRDDKKYNIGTMIHNCLSLEKIEKEILKCDIRCANCHRRKTAKTFDWWRNNIE